MIPLGRAYQTGFAYLLLFLFRLMSRPDGVVFFSSFCYVKFLKVA